MRVVITSVKGQDSRATSKDGISITKIPERVKSFNQYLQQKKRQLNGLGMRQKQAQGAQEAAIIEAPMSEEQSGNSKTKKNVLTADMPPLCPSNQMNRRPEVKRMSRSKSSVEAKANNEMRTVVRGQRNRAEKSTGSSSRKKKQRTLNAQASASKKDIDVRDNRRKHVCPECGNKYSGQLDLITHTRIHTGEKPYVCGVCHAAFSDIRNLTRHQRIHSGLKPFKCEICSFAAHQKTDLNRHSLIHTNEKLFVCDICEKAFRRKDHLVNHMRIHSGKRLLQQ